MTGTLLATKLHFPQIHPNLVARPRLIKILEKGLHDLLTLISAPADSGKTTLMSEWRADAKNRMPVAWLSLDSADNDPLRLLTYLTASVESASPTLTRSIAPLLQSPRLPPLDACHVISNITIHETLNKVLEYTPLRSTWWSSRAIIKAIRDVLEMIGSSK